MLKWVFMIILSVIMATPTLATPTIDFSQMNPTVQVVSYKKLYTDQVIAMGSGSGTIISSNGIVLTNHHVIFDDNEQKPLDTFGICITFRVEEEPVCRYTAKLIADNKDMDTALLKINPKDVFGVPLPPLKTITINDAPVPKEGTSVQVIGYPASGGNTVTITTGKISGFDEYNDFTYFKTDTDFDHGSSGGTVLDTDGNFIGIPTYIRSYAENVGYFLDLREAKAWVNENKGNEATVNQKAESRLIEELARFEKANDNLTLTYTDYPQASVSLPKDWKFIQISDDGFYAEQNKKTEAVGVGVFFDHYPYPIDQGYLDELDEALSQIKQYNPDYKKEAIVFAGTKGFEITYSSYNQTYHGIYLPYGHTMIGVHYTIDLDEREKQEEAIKPVLDAITIESEPRNQSTYTRTVSFDEPPFSITAPEGWLMQKNISGQPMHLLASAIQNQNYKGSVNLYYNRIPKDELSLSAKEQLDTITKDISGGDQKLLSKKDDVVLDGLKGWLFTYEYEGEKYQEAHKKMVVTLKDGDYEFRIEYDDLDEVFDKNLPDIQTMLASFNFEGETENKGEYEIGSLERIFSDIQYHRFANSISALAEKGIVKGYEDGTFRPESPVTRAEAIKIILESKNHLEKERGLGKELSFEVIADESSVKANTFRDVKASDWFFSYVHHATDKKILEGYADKTFRPHHFVTLAEALKMIFGVYEIPLWQGETDPWWKKVMDKGYELYLIPRGMENPAIQLTRAQLADLVDNVYSQAK